MIGATKGQHCSIDLNSQVVDLVKDPSIALE